MRKVHRWLMTVFAVLLLYVAASGVVLNVYDYTDPTQTYAREGGGAGAATPINPMGLVMNEATPITEQELSPMLAVALATAQQVAPGEPIGSLELHIEHAVPLIAVNIMGARPRQIRVNASSGAVLDNNAPRVTGGQRNWHAAIKSWHRGVEFGPVGATMVFLTGCAFLTLCITGIVMYFNLWQQRRRIGRRYFFW